MEWLSDIANIASGGLLGSVLGILTSTIGTYFKHKEVLARNAHELNLIKANSDASIREIEAQVKVQRIVTEGNILLEENRADTEESVGRASMLQVLTGKYISDDILKTIIADDTKIGLFIRPFIYLHLLFMDAVRGLIRPVLTVGIVWYVTYLTNIALEDYLTDDFAKEELMEMVIEPAVMLILFSTSTVVSFWFADRSMARRFQKGQKNE